MVYANPFNSCEQCGARTTGTDDHSRNQPCGHTGGFRSVCPSWSPVDGCNCLTFLGAIDHGLPRLPGGAE